MNEQPEIINEGKYIKILLHKDTLYDLMEGDYEIVNFDKAKEEFCELLKNRQTQNSQETGLTALQELFQETIHHVYESGKDYLLEKEY